jgi:hypothetical protein
LHEFGHAVHNNLSATRHSSQAGTGVLRDFVEAPSQMLEQWVYDPKVLQVMREVCASCAPVPEALLAQARKEGRGKLKIFLGAAPGVGKTYEMLTQARQRKLDGVDVVIGVVETHGRRDTQALLRGDMKAVLVTLRRALESQEHRDFVAA